MLAGLPSEIGPPLGCSAAHTWTPSLPSSQFWCWQTCCLCSGYLTITRLTGVPDHHGAAWPLSRDYCARDYYTCAWIPQPPSYLCTWLCYPPKLANSSRKSLPSLIGLLFLWYRKRREVHIHGPTKGNHSWNHALNHLNPGLRNIWLLFFSSLPVSLNICH